MTNYIDDIDFIHVTPEIIQDITRIHDQLNRTTGKFTQEEILDMFMKDETLNIDARLIASENVEDSFSNSSRGALEFTHGVCAYLRAALVRLNKKIEQ
jgi:hypothetical protein